MVNKMYNTWLNLRIILKHCFRHTVTFRFILRVNKKNKNHWSNWIFLKHYLLTSSNQQHFIDSIKGATSNCTGLTPYIRSRRMILSMYELINIVNDCDDLIRLHEFDEGLVAWIESVFKIIYANTSYKW